MNNTFANEKPESTDAVQYLFSKTSVFTLSCSLAAMTIFLLLMTLVSAFDARQLNELKAIYYFAGNSNIAVGIINFVFGIIACAILFFTSFGMFSAIDAVKKQTPETFLKSTKIIKISLLSAIIFTVIMIICSLSSVSIINYEYRISADINSYYNISNNYADSLFFLTILFGTLSMTLEIALTRLILALERTAKSGLMEKQGSALTIVTSSVGAITMIIVFLSVLFNLVLPSSVNNGIPRLSPATLAMNILTVMLAAALSVMFIALIIAASVYVGFLEEIKRSQHTRIYNNLFASSSPSTYKNYSSMQNHNYNQPDNYPPYYDNNRAYNSVYRNIYENYVPPIPKKPEMPFKPPVDIPHTKYPSQNSYTEKETENEIKTPTISLEKSEEQVKKGD